GALEVVEYASPAVGASRRHIDYCERLARTYLMAKCPLKNYLASRKEFLGDQRIWATDVQRYRKAPRPLSRADPGSDPGPARRDSDHRRKEQERGRRQAPRAEGTAASLLRLRGLPGLLPGGPQDPPGGGPGPRTRRRL